MPGKFDKVILYAVNLVIFSIVFLKKADKICLKHLKTIAVNSGKNNQRLQPINAAKRKKKRKKKTKQPPQLITKKYQLFLLNNTNQWRFTVQKIFPCWKK